MPKDNLQDIRELCGLCEDWRLGNCGRCNLYKKRKSMETKRWLGRGRTIDERIGELLEEAETIGAGGEERRAYAALIDAKIDGLYSVKREVLKAIGTVDDPTLQRLLILRYIRFMTWEEIAETMHYSYMQVCRLHGRALQMVKCNIQNET